MSELIFEGTLVEILPEQSGVSKAGKEWRTVDFIVESGGQYPKQAGFNLFGDKIDLISKYNVGDTLSVKFNLESRVVNGKVYTKASAWKIDSVGSTQNSNDSENEPIYQSGLSIKEQIMEQKAQEPEPEGDDLPF